MTITGKSFAVEKTKSVLLNIAPCISKASKVDSKHTVAMESVNVYISLEKGTFNVKASGLKSNKLNILVYDINGRLIFNKGFTGYGINEIIKLENAQSGLHFIILNDGISKHVKKIIIK